jgi:hypothetical protein
VKQIVCVDGVKGDPRVVSVVRDTERRIGGDFTEDELGIHTRDVPLTSAFLATVYCAGKAMEGGIIGALTPKQQSHRHLKALRSQRYLMIAYLKGVLFSVKDV